jgi:hypothetical protein
MTNNESFEEFLKMMTSEIREGLRHGFFEYRLKGEIVHGRKRQLVLEAGKKYKFIISEDEVTQSSQSDR